MKQILITMGLVAMTSVAGAGEFLGDVRLPGKNEVNSQSKRLQTLELNSCQNGYRVSEIQITAEQPARIAKVTVVYGNGSSAEVPVRLKYKANSQTRWKDITGPAGRARCVREIQIRGMSLTNDEVGGALIGVNAETHAGGNNQPAFNSGPVTFFREDFTCSGFGRRYTIPYSPKKKRQRQLCNQHGQAKTVKYALIQGKCVQLNKENMQTVCPKVMNNQGHYYTHNGNPPLSLLDLLFD